MDTGQTGNRWGLTAPESYILLHGPEGGPGGVEEAFKLAFVELAARGYVATDEGDTRAGDDQTARDDPLLFRGEADFPPKEGPLSAAFAAFEDALGGAASSGSGNPEDGVSAAEVSREAERRYGKLSGYAEEEVFPALRARGLYELGEGRILGIFPREKWRETEAARRRAKIWRAPPGRPRRHSSSGRAGIRRGRCRSWGWRAARRCCSCPPCTRR